MPATDPPPAVCRGTALLLLAALSAGGCTAVTVAGVVMDALTDVSVTVKGDEDVLSALQEQLTSKFGVETAVSAVETGVHVVEIIGAYAAVVDSLTWMAAQGLELLANDAISETVLTVAVAFLK